MRRIIDAHNHPDWYDYDAARFVANMDEHGIEKTWLMSWECPLDEFDHLFKSWEYRYHGSMPYEHCLDYYRYAPERFVLGYAPDLRRPEALDLVSYAIEHLHMSFLGEVKIRVDYDNPDAIRIFRYCGERGVPVLLDYNHPRDCGRVHPRPDHWSGGPIESLERVLRKCPETVIIGHDAGFWAYLSDDEGTDRFGRADAPVKRGGKLERLFDRYPNLYGDCSGPAITAMFRDVAYARELIIRFQDRMLFGRDYVDDYAFRLNDALNLPPDAYEKFVYANAARLIPGEEGGGSA